MSNKLILRKTNSPFTGQYADINQGSVLSHAQLDGNFIYLKGNMIYSGTTAGSVLKLHKLNNTSVDIDLSSLIESGDTYLTGGTFTASAGTLTLINNTGGTFNVTGITFDDTYLTGGTYDYNTGIITFTNNFGNDFQVTGIEFSGNTSANCISDIWVSNVHGCSPVTFYNSIQSSSATTVGEFDSISFGENTTAIASESIQIPTPINIFSACTFTTSDPSNALPAIILSGDVSNEWSVYIWDFCTEFLISGSSGTEIINLGCNVYDIYYDSGYTYIVDSSLTGTGYTLISGDTFYYVDDTVVRPAYAFGQQTIATGIAANAEGRQTTASGNYSHTEGSFTTASSEDAHAEGQSNLASGAQSHAEGFKTTASGSASHAEGSFSTASGQISHAEGYNNTASGGYSHAEGISNKSIGGASHAEGANTVANGAYSHTEGWLTITSGQSAHAEGYQTTAIGNYGSHSEGYLTTAIGDYGSHAEGYSTTANGYFSHAEGGFTKSNGSYSHAEGSNTISAGMYSHAEGQGTLSSGDGSHAEGGVTTSSGPSSHAEGFYSVASGSMSHAEGYSSLASGSGSHAEGGAPELGGAFSGGTASNSASHAEGIATRATAVASHAEGRLTTASGLYSHSEGYLTTASGAYSHAEGENTLAAGKFGTHAEGYSTTASGSYAHAEGNSTKALSDYSHAEGQNTTASATASHAEGSGTVVTGATAHAEGDSSKAYGSASHAEGNKTTASGAYSHAEGQQSIASSTASHAEGYLSIASGLCSHAEGGNSSGGEMGGLASGTGSHAEGIRTTASGGISHAEGYRTTASGSMAHAGGYNSIADGTSSFIHSYNSRVDGFASVVLGGQNITGTTNETVYVPNLNINYTPANDNALTQVLVRATDGTVKYKNVSSFTDMTVTGGTYDANTGVATFTNNSGGTFTVSGFLTGMTDTYTTGVTLNNTILEFGRTDGSNLYSVDLSSLEFTGNTSANCISDIYVSNIHSCSPLHVNSNDEGDVYFGSNSGVTIDVANSRIGVGTNNPSYSLDVRGNAVFNENGGNFDFRVEGDTNQHLIFVDASTDRVGINTSIPDTKFSIATLEGDGLSFDGMTDASLVGKHKFYTKQAEVSTTSTNSATLITIPLVSGDRITLRGMITAIGGGSLVVGGTFSAVGYNNAGTASIVGTVDTSIKSANSLGSPTFTVSVSGGNITVIVTGGGENTQWVATYEYQIVAAPEA